ncbi:hypothetical protein CRENBAI_011351, partial [Crenichthys baileyi]
ESLHISNLEQRDQALGSETVVGQQTLLLSEQIKWVGRTPSPVQHSPQRGPQRNWTEGHSELISLCWQTDITLQTGSKSVI